MQTFFDILEVAEAAFVVPAAAAVAALAVMMVEVGLGILIY